MLRQYLWLCVAKDNLIRCAWTVTSVPISYTAKFREFWGKCYGHFLSFSFVRYFGAFWSSCSKCSLIKYVLGTEFKYLGTCCKMPNNIEYNITRESYRLRYVCVNTCDSYAIFIVDSFFALHSHQNREMCAVVVFVSSFFWQTAKRATYNNGNESCDIQVHFDAVHRMIICANGCGSGI